MKIAVSSTGKDLQAQLDPRFGRAPYFIIVQEDSLDFEAIPNPHAQAGGGAGIQAAQLVVDRGVEVVITGNCGPNAFQVLQAAGIQVLTGAAGSIRDAVSQFKSGHFQAAQSPNVGDHFGMDTGRSGQGRGMGKGQGGRGMGRGGGRGMGGGRGGVFRKGTS